MRTTFFKFLIITTIVSVFSSCLWDDEEVVYSSDPTFVSLVFEENDSIPGLEDAVFTYEYDVDLGDSVIVNLDSLPYQTRIDSVFPKFTFRSSAIQLLIMKDSLGTGMDTIALSGNDTIDFNKVLMIQNYASDGIANKTYDIKVNVHQVEPKLYVWNKKVSQIYTHDGSVQKAVFFKDKFFFYVSSGVNNYLYTSSNAVNWGSQALSGLPPNCNFRDITAYNNKLYFVHEDGNVYASTDGYLWTAMNPGVAGYTINNLLFELDNNLWSVFKNQLTQKYYFGTSADGAAWIIDEMIPNDFPVVGFAAHSFKSRTDKTKAIVLGGYSAVGDILSSVWSVQKNVFNEYKWVNFSAANATLNSLSGASVISYDDKLLLFGGMDIDDNIVETDYMESIDEGLTWRSTDTTHNVIEDMTIPLSYQARSYQSVIHDTTSHYIYLVGGRTKDRVFSDVWVGKLNRLSFLR
jgi:hypothetical protein